MNARVAWHENQSGGRDAYFRRTNAAKMAEDPESWAICPGVVVESEDGEEAEVCGQPFKPITREDQVHPYRVCWSCSNVERVRSTLACIFCDKRHQVKFASCYLCRPIPGRDDEAVRLRGLVLQRHSFACNMCGDDEAAVLQVDKIQPFKLGGGWAPWNLEPLCAPCSVLKGSNYGPHDEMAQWNLIEAYLTYLAPYLTEAEARALQVEAVDLGGSWVGSPPRGVGQPDGYCTEARGIHSVAETLGATTIPGMVPAPPAAPRTPPVWCLPPTSLPEPPEGVCGASATMLKLALAHEWDARAVYATYDQSESILLQAVKGARRFEAHWQIRHNLKNPKWQFASALGEQGRMASEEAKAYLRG